MAKAELNLNDFPWLLGTRLVQMDTRPSTAANSNQHCVTIERIEVWQPLIKFSFLSYDPAGEEKKNLLMDECIF